MPESADPTCAVAHGAAPFQPVPRTLVAVFASEVAEYLLRYGQDLGFRPVLLEPDESRTTPFPSFSATDLDWTTDVVVTDHHRDELGPVLRDVLKHPVRWVGVLGNPRHPAPHIPALRALGGTGCRHRPGPPPDRPQHRLPDPTRNRPGNTGGPPGRPQQPPRRLRVLISSTPDRE